MNYGKKSPTGTPSVYSHVTTRSSANLRSGMSIKSLKTPWYQKPLITNALFWDVQRAAFYMGIFALCLSIFTIITSCFDMYCYWMASPGSTHYGYYFISYQFVYVGNRHVRNTLVMIAIFSLLLSMAVFVTSIMVIIAVRKEYEKKMVPWLFAFGIFTVFRFLGFLFFYIVNDMIFAYNIIIVFFWTLFIVVCMYGWLVVYSFYVELHDLTKLEDLAHLRTFERIQLGRDGHHAVAECIDSPFPGGFSPDDAPQHRVHDAGQLTIDDDEDATHDASLAGPSRSISFFTDTDLSVATRSTLPFESNI